MGKTESLENVFYTKDKTGLINKTYLASSILFVIMIVVGVAHLIQKSSSFGFEIPQETEKSYIVLVAMIVVVKSLLLLAVKHGKEDFKIVGKWLSLSLLIAVVFVSVYHNLREITDYPEYNRYLMVLFIAISVVGTVGVDYEKLIKIYIVVAAFMITVIVFAAICGAIPNYIYQKDWHIRSSWGIAYPTDMASYLFYICAFFWAAYCKKKDLLFLAPAGIALLIAYFVARSETSTICDIALIIVILLNYIFMQNRLTTIRRIAEVVAIGAFPTFTLLMIWLMAAYSKGYGFAIKINELISDRLNLAVNAYKEYGISLFGSPLKQIGWGGGKFAVEGYNFVDSSYCLLLLNYGIIVLVMVNVLWMLMTRKAIKTGDRRLAFVMALIAVHALSEHHFIEPNFNILIAMPVAVLMRTAGKETGNTKPSDEPIKRSFIKETNSRRLYVAVISLVVVIALVIIAHRLLPWARTIFTYSSFTDTPEERKALFAAIGMLVVGVVLLLYFIYGMTNEFLTDKGKKRVQAYAAAVLLITIAGGGLLWKCNNYLEGAFEKRSDIVRSDQDAIKVITEAQGNLYVYGLPEFYIRNYGNIETSLFDGEELARYKSATVVVDKELDSPIFFGHGFLYTPISDYHSIYTNDAKVIKALENKGYKLHGFYCVPSYVDLKFEAEQNSLDYKKGEPLRVSEGEKALTRGPYYNLRSGRYTLSFDLAMDKSSIERNAANEEIAVIEVSKDFGEADIISAPVLIDQFDEEGNARVDVIYTVPDTRAVEFKIKPKKGITIFVKSIENKKTPEFDVRRGYDSKGRIIHEDYYDLEGNQVTISAGYAGKDISYDKKGNASKEKYYDNEGKKTINKNGICEVRRVYNSDNAVVKESYYDTDGELCMRSEGYAITTIKYDDAGRIISQSFFDEHDGPAKDEKGVFEIKRKYNEMNQLIREEYYDSEGNLMNQVEGYAYTTMKYDNNGKITTQRFYNKDGKEITV